MNYTTSVGHTHPLGPHYTTNSLNFALHAPAASQVHLVLFPSQTSIAMHRTESIWHIELIDPPEEVSYYFLLTSFKGKTTPIFDPYSYFLSSSSKWGQLDYRHHQVHSIAKRPAAFDWEGSQSPKHPLHKTIFYEMHLRGFTRDPSSHVQSPGTFKGAIEKIPYLKSLGITCVELMPIQEFNESELDRIHPHTGKRLTNYWGYSPIHFFCIMNRYLSMQNEINEVKTFVRELHKNGIEVILDVVYNHTGGYCPLYHCDPHYYIVQPNKRHTNYTGCGNTLNANSPPTMHLILESLRYLVTEFHVDGFRFDLASTLTRDKQGHPLEDPPVIRAIANDPILKNIKLIAEPWDPGGLYQVGSFPHQFADWNGWYRDIARRYINTMQPDIHEVRLAMTASSHLFGNKSPAHSINLITAHDGFTLKDLVSYSHKHNEINGEKNRDGNNCNFSINFGFEGEKQSLNAIRKQQVKNFFLFLFCSIGTPLIVMGDEIGISHRGNNNPWCQDSTLNWLHWDKMDKDLLFYCIELIKLRKNLPHFDIQSYDDLNRFEWLDQPDHQVLCLKINAPEVAPICIVINPTSHQIALSLPPGKWKQMFANFYYSPHHLIPHSSVILEQVND